METKICSKCQLEKPIDDFRWKNKSKNLKHSQCKECQKTQEKQHYQESIARQESVRKTADGQKTINIKLVEQAKSNGCKKCGEKRLYVLDFHHRDGDEKIATINRMIKSASAETLAIELKKCDVLCANCHREFHYLNIHNQLDYNEYIWADNSDDKTPD